MIFFAYKIGIPFLKLEKFLFSNKGKRRKMNNHGCGNKPLLSDFDIDFVGQVAARKDLVNERLPRREIIDLIQELDPTIARHKASRQLSRHIVPKGHEKGYIKGLVKPQTTTTNRTAIIIPQQFWYHMLVGNEYSSMQLNNTGVCPVLKRSFGELMPHFVCWLGRRIHMCRLLRKYQNLRIYGKIKA